MDVNQLKTVVASAFVLCFFTLLSCFFTLGQFMLFLSSHTSLNSMHKYNSDCKLQDCALSSIVQNVVLLLVVLLQHTLQANEKFKRFLNLIGWSIYERLLYNCGSCLALQILMYFWRSIPVMTVWDLSDSNKFFWCFFASIHLAAWLITYSGCFIMDVTDLLGVKQVYYYLRNWPQPFTQRSEGLQRFYSHMRHPGFSALVVILYIHPVMQIDRLILASTLTIYMLLRCKVDEIDYAYQKRMLQRKYRDLYLND